MPGFFEAMKNIKPVAKKHTVTVQGKEIEVSLEKKLEIQRAGEDKYMLEGKDIVLIPKPKTARRFPVLVGYKQDPYWIETDKGLLWQIEPE
jgi:hypothetical protein